MNNLLIFFTKFFCKIISLFYRNNKAVLVYLGNDFDQTFFFGNKSNNLSIIFDYINENHLFQDYTFRIIANTSISPKYENLSSNIKFIYCNNQDNLYFNRIKYKLFFYYNIYISKFIFSSNPYYRPFIKCYNQKLIVFNYYSPFKRDHIIKKPLCKIDFLFSSSEFFAEYLAKTTDTDLINIINLGFPRLDTLLNKTNDRPLILRSLGINFIPSKILVYAPTHRNFWNEKFGNESIDIVFGLSNLLVDSDTVLIIFPHPTSVINLSNIKLPDNIFIGHANFPYTLYDVLAISDALISDYSSVYIDYLCLDKPVFFHFIDYNNFLSTRGFAFDDYSKLIAGPISYDSEMLYSNLNDFLKKGIDLYSSQRKSLNILFYNNFISSYTKQNIEYLKLILN